MFRLQGLQGLLWWILGSEFHGKTFAFHFQPHIFVLRDGETGNDENESGRLHWIYGKPTLCLSYYFHTRSPINGEIWFGKGVVSAALSFLCYEDEEVTQGVQLVCLEF
jgi:hypothetical protein